MSASDIQTLLRFLSQDAKVSLAIAMSKVKELQAANLDSPELLSKAKADDIKDIFDDEKTRKQIISAAKRVSRKRAAGGDESAISSPKKKAKKESLFSAEPVSAADLESSLKLPECTLGEDELKNVKLFTNRAPLVLAFLVTMLKYTMPEQPLSSRLSLAQAYVSITSRSRAVSLGIESGQSAEEEGFGQGQPVVTVCGKKIKVLRRWGYEWKDSELKDAESGEDKPALWALDLIALKKTGSDKQPAAETTAINSNLPIYTPQSARAYLIKSFENPPDPALAPSKKLSAAATVAEKEQNLGKLLKALDLLYDSWSSTLSIEELDKRMWGWYVKVRPAVNDGVAGWGGKNVLKLGDILALRKEAARDVS